MTKSPINTENISDVELRQITVFKTVVECGGITAAELRLNKGKSAISMDLSSLEQRLGMTLCHRGPSGFSLTEQGKSIYAAAKQLIANIELFRQQTHEAQSQLTGKLNLHLADNAVWDHQLDISEVIANFHQAEPNIYINIVGSGPNEVAQAVLSGQADLGIDVLPRQSAALNCLPLYKEDLFLYCGDKHPLFSADCEELSLATLKHYEFIRIVTLRDATLEALLDDCRMTASASNLDMRAAMILSGQYLGFLPSHMAKHWTQTQKMRALMPETMSTCNDVYIITNKSQTCNPARDRFITAVNKVLNKHS
ncbi:LysR family transcriptional regulator [Dasania marina]|uniref:LysR family transcriptional regulator n=1 Tax=Dasania marina TaxID=471499 RepID=UPI00036A1AB6|nr:LysR family transcriptional regulator [Dasania marina]